MAHKRMFVCHLSVSLAPNLGKTTQSPQSDLTPRILTLCPGQYAGITEVSFKCQSVNALLFVSDANGVTTQPELPTEGQVIDIVVRESSLTRQFLNSKYFLLPRQDVNFPENGFVMDVVIIYDDSYRDTLHRWFSVTRFDYKGA